MYCIDSLTNCQVYFESLLPSSWFSDKWLGLQIRFAAVGLRHSTKSGRLKYKVGGLGMAAKKALAFFYLGVFSSDLFQD